MDFLHVLAFTAGVLLVSRFTAAPVFVGIVLLCYAGGFI